MNDALKASWTGGYMNMSPSYVVIEDRITPGVTKYGEIDREAQIFSGSGTKTKWLYYTPDADEPKAKPVTQYTINGQVFKFANSEASSSSVPKTIASPTGSVPAYFDGKFCTRESNTQDSTKYCKTVGQRPECTMDAMKGRLNLKRSSSFKLPSDVNALAGRLSWQWRCETPADVFLEFKQNAEDGGPLLLYDTNGDLVEETIKSMEEAGDQYVIESVAQYGSSMNPNCSEGLLPEVSIYTSNSGTYLKIEEFPDGTSKRTVQSSSSKSQADLIERKFRVSSAGGVEGAFHSCTSVDVSGACGDGSCCFTQVDPRVTCLDKGSNILYIRSNLKNTRKTSWFGSKKNK